MAYFTGTFTDANNLLDIIRASVVSEGWTLSAFTAEGAGYRLHVVSPDGDVWGNMRSGISEQIYSGYTLTGIGMNGSTGYSSSLDWNKQPGTGNLSGKGGAIPYIETGTYHIGVHDNVFCVFAESSKEGNWYHFHIGKTTQGFPIYDSSHTYSYTYIEGSFLTLSSYAQYAKSLLIDGEWLVGEYSAIDSLQPPLQHTTSLSNSYFMASSLVIASKDQLRGNAMLVPSYYTMGLTTSGYTGAKMYLGHVENVCCVGGDMYSNGDVVTYGNDEYVLSTIGDADSTNYSFMKAAFKK